MTLTRTLLSATTLLTFPPLVAEASERRVFVDVGTVSALHDRGEQIGREVLEFGAGVEMDVQEATVYGAFYRLLPFGGEQEAFDDEADYTLGVAWEGRGYSADASVNLLTFPGEDAESSVELAGAVTLDVPLVPTLIGFYDVDIEDRGLELSAGPEWDAGSWSLYAIGRAGLFIRVTGLPIAPMAGLSSALRVRCRTLLNWDCSRVRMLRMKTPSRAASSAVVSPPSPLQGLRQGSASH